MQKYEKKVYMYEDTLIINNIRYSVNDLDNLPDDVHLKKFCTKSNDTTEVFGGILSEHSTLSNWSPSQIEYNSNVYVNLEQAYMHIKALENGDNVAARKIRYTKDPGEIKRIGSMLAVYNIVSLSHPQLSLYGSAHHISPIRVWRRTLNCMVGLYSYQCLQIVH